MRPRCRDRTLEIFDLKEKNKNLQAELKRLRQVVQQGQIRSPVNGTVVKVHCFAGDFSTLSQRELEVAVELCEIFGARLILHHNLNLAPPAWSKALSQRPLRP